MNESREGVLPLPQDKDMEFLWRIKKNLEIMRKERSIFHKTINADVGAIDDVHGRMNALLKTFIGF